MEQLPEGCNPGIPFRTRRRTVPYPRPFKGMDYVRPLNNDIAMGPCRPTYMYILDFPSYALQVNTVMERGYVLWNTETYVGCQKAQHRACTENFQLLSLRKALR
jgi:hypothetical protein